jgi:hypothetical protein
MVTKQTTVLPSKSWSRRVCKSLSELKIMLRRETNISEDLVVICNVNIHKKLNVTREVFLEKVRVIKEIRCSWAWEYTSYYISTIEEYKNLKHLYDIVNSGEFPENKHQHWFAIAINPRMYEWFKSNSFHVIERQIVFWMASLYFFNPGEREIFNRQFYKPILQEIKKIIQSTYIKNYPLINVLDIDQNLVKSIDDIDKREFEYDPLEVYKAQSTTYSGVEPPKFLSNPFGLPLLFGEDDWGLSKYSFGFIKAYLTDSDWDNILINQEEDPLIRAESHAELWEKWKHTFTFYEITKRPVYSFYLFEDEKLNKLIDREPKEGNRREGFIYLMRNPIFEQGIYKIGLTRKNPEIRARKLPNTSVPGQFYIICEWFVSDCVKVETRLKKVLRPYIVDLRREFYRLNYREMMRIISEEIDKFNKE